MSRSGRKPIRAFLPRGYKFESPADAGLSNCSIGAGAPAAAFGKTAFADFASARYKNEQQTDRHPQTRP